MQAGLALGRLEPQGVMALAADAVRVRVRVWYIDGPERHNMVTSLQPKYMPHADTSYGHCFCEAKAHGSYVRTLVGPSMHKPALCKP